MKIKSGKTVSFLHIGIILIILLTYLGVFILLDIYLNVFPFPLIVAPVIVLSWFWGLRRGILAGMFLILSIILVVLFFHLRQSNPVQGVFAVTMSIILGAGAGWVRKLYNSEKEYSLQLAEQKKALLREVEIRQKAEKRALWNEHFLKTMSNSSHLGILAVNNSTNEVLFCNRRFCEIWGIEKLQDKINKNEIKNSELIELCLPGVKDSAEYNELFKPTLDINARKVIDTDIEFENGSFIRHFTSQIRDEKDEYLGRLFIYEDITDQKRAGDLLKKRSEYDRLIYQISNRFVNAAESKIDEAFSSSLQTAGELLGMDMGYFYQADTETLEAFLVYEWRSDRVSHDLNRKLRISSELYPSFGKKLTRFDEVVVPDVNSLPVEYFQEKKALLERGINAIIIIPVVIKHQFAGFLSFSSFTAIEITDDAVAALKMIGDVFAGAFIRRQEYLTLIESEERFRLLIQYSTDMIGILDVNGYVTYVSPASQTITGKSSEEWLGKLLYPFLHPDDADKIKAAVQRFVEEPDLPLVKLSLRFPAEQDRTIYLETILNNQLYNPAIKGIVCNSRDMSQHFIMQNALRNSSNFLNAVINSARDPMFVKDSGYRYTVVNEAFCSLTGFSKEQIVGKTDYDLHEKEFADRTREKDDYVFNNGGIENFEAEFVDHYGKKHFIVANEICYQDERGRKFVIANIRDESRRKKMEEDIRNTLVKEKELSDMKSKFISMVSHEYRTPLTTILSSADLLDLFGPDMTNNERREFLLTIKNSVKYLTNLVNDVLLLNRSESGRLNYLPSRFELMQFCSEIVKNFDTPEGSRVILKSNMSSKKVGMDRKLLTHILMNLLSNALKYSQGGSLVEFNVKSEDEHVAFEILDKGIGIPEESFPHLFEPFYRAENAANINGSGLGLCIVKNCVDIHNGDIFFKSIEGLGTTFTVKIPDDRTVLLDEK